MGCPTALAPPLGSARTRRGRRCRRRHRRLRRCGDLRHNRGQFAFLRGAPPGVRTGRRHASRPPRTARLRRGTSAVDSTSLHGEFVVPDGAGGYTTVLTQTGTVTAISPTSITVRSEDGFSQTYVIPSTAGNASAPFAMDDRVVVRATR